MNANLSGAVVTGASFWGTTSRGFTRAQLESTASYQAKNLQGITLGEIGSGVYIPTSDLIGWDFSWQNLTNAQLNNSRLIGANLSGANLTGAKLWATLTSANLSKANLTNANLNNSTLTNDNLSGANLKNANLDGTTAVQSAVFAPSTIYNQWTVFPAGFDPAASGLTLMPSPPGDIDADDDLDFADIDLLQFRIRNGDVTPNWLPPALFDLNSDDAIDLEDVDVWV